MEPADALPGCDVFFLARVGGELRPGASASPFAGCESRQPGNDFESAVLGARSLSETAALGRRYRTSYWWFHGKVGNSRAGPLRAGTVCCQHPAAGGCITPPALGATASTCSS